MNTEKITKLLEELKEAKSNQTKYSILINLKTEYLRLSEEANNMARQLRTIKDN
jgi:hypothetical protein